MTNPLETGSGADPRREKIAKLADFSQRIGEELSSVLATHPHGTDFSEIVIMDLFEKSEGDASKVDFRDMEAALDAAVRSATPQQ